MTNEEKFTEVFGFKPDTEFSPFECPEPFASDKCKYYEELDGGCHCETWWDEKYNDDNSNAISLEEIDKAWECISDVSEGGYVDMEEVKLWFAKWLGKDEDEL